MTTTKPPVWFWIISILALIWNSMGVNQYLQQAYNTEAFKSMVSTEELEMISQLPTWYTAVFAIAVFAGALGCILLLLRKSSKRFSKFPIFLLRFYRLLWLISSFINCVI